MTLDFATILQITMFVMAFYITYVCLTQDVF
jgi:hypothetical protein